MLRKTILMIALTTATLVWGPASAQQPDDNALPSIPVPGYGMQNFGHATVPPPPSTNTGVMTNTLPLPVPGYGMQAYGKTHLPPPSSPPESSPRGRTDSGSLHGNRAPGYYKGMN